jgi:phosphoribosylaminoimidazole-succinocarboxamide synthase
MSDPAKTELIAEGKAKKVYATEDPDKVILYFKDDATAFNAKKKGTIVDKGILNNRISQSFFLVLEESGIKTHFIKELSEREMLVQKVDIIPCETVVRNIVTGSLQKRLGRPDGEELSHPVVEYYYKSDPLDDPMINDEHAIVFGWATREELNTIHEQALAVNSLLRQFIADRGILLVDFKLEFGRGPDGSVLLADEICPDTCRFWDSQTREKLDKDRFRQYLGNVEGAYQEIMDRVSRA